MEPEESLDFNESYHCQPVQSTSIDKILKHSKRSQYMCWLHQIATSANQLDPLKYEGYLLLDNNCNTFNGFEYKTPFHYHVKRLTIINKNYSCKEILDKEMIENPPNSLIKSEKIDQHILECIALTQPAKITDEAVKIFNPIFHQPYSRTKESFISICNTVNHFYQEYLFKPILCKIPIDMKQFGQVASTLSQVTKLNQKSARELMFRIKSFQEDVDPHLHHPNSLTQDFFNSFVTLLQSQPNERKSRIELQTLCQLLSS